ncbi:MAG: hypothetical protein HRU09_16535 [Oligoflexales bacterium]|nr:hypothetical protein [Oligoflexales bacterium]
MSLKRRKILSCFIAFLVVIGFLQIIGYLSGQSRILGLGFITAASPLPLVFLHFRGSEPFSAQYFIRWNNNKGESKTIHVGPEQYAKLKGPYNLRNVYGAIFAAGPVFQENPREKKLWTTVMKRAFCKPAFLKKSFELPEDLESIELEVISRGRGLDGNWKKSISC